MLGDEGINSDYVTELLLCINVECESAKGYRASGALVFIEHSFRVFGNE